MNPLLQRVINKFGFISKAQTQEIVNETIRSIHKLRTAQTGWQAAAINRLTNYWTTQNLSADSTIRKDLLTLRARSRELCENNDYAKGALGIFKSNVIGECGIQLKNKAKDLPRGNEPTGALDKFANRVIEDAWWDWNKLGNCTVDRSMCGVDRQNLSLETAARDGEVMIRKVAGFNNPSKFAVQILESDYLDFDYNDRLGNGNEIRMGVELNRWKEPIAYWMLKAHPNDGYFSPASQFDRHVRIGKEEIIHAYIRFRPEQSRGVPWMATSMFRMSVVGKYEESEAIASRLAASKMGFFTKTGANVQYEGKDDGMGNKTMDSEPGAFEELPAGMDVTTVNWDHPNSSYQTFMKTALRGISTGLGLSYNTFANDMESVNFASGKLGIEAEREIFKALQQWYIWNIENRIFESWLEVQLLTQNIPLPFSKLAKFNAPDWRPRRWSYINPQQEVAAQISKINAGLTSPQRVIAEQGGDIEELYEEIKADKALAKKHGLEFSEVPVMMDAPEDPEEDPAQSKPKEPEEAA